MKRITCGLPTIQYSERQHIHDREKLGVAAIFLVAKLTRDGAQSRVGHVLLRPAHLLAVEPRSTLVKLLLNFPQLVTLGVN